MTTEQQTPVACPFCEGQPCVVKINRARYVECNRCDASTRLFYGPTGEQDAWDAWSTRVSKDGAK